MVVSNTLFIGGFMVIKRAWNLIHQAQGEMVKEDIYSAEAKRLPALKVGKQWRFPADQVESWLQGQTGTPTLKAEPKLNGNRAGLASLWPLEYLQLIQDTFAQALGVMIVITDMAGNPLSEVSNPCGLFRVINQTPNAVQKCIETGPASRQHPVWSRNSSLAAWVCWAHGG